MILLGLIFLTAGSVLAQEKTWSTPVVFRHQGVEVRVLNWELTRDRKTILLHAKLRCESREPVYFDWRNLFTLRDSSGGSSGSVYDALVDRNGAGLTRTVNEFRLVYREKARITIPYLVETENYPFRLEMPDGRVSVLIK